MPEARNNFLKSKMNKDLEQRLVPVGEYRDALNVMISRSEGDDVGALENVLGNALLSEFKISDSDTCCGEEVIGYFMDMINDRVFVFTTNFSDTSADQLSDFAPTSALCGIFLYDLTNGTVTNIVQGYYLNFSKTQEITGVNVIEQYLYWTDNRNQPRKINITRALADTSYYTNEDQISVSKYYPHTSPLLINKEVNSYAVTNPGSNFNVGDICTLAPFIGTEGPGNGFEIRVESVDPITGEILTVKILNTGIGYASGPYYIVNPNNPAVITWGTINLSTDWLSTMYDRTNPKLPDGVAENPLYDPQWNGDKNWMSDKFIRFAYRFKFDDGEYSLISPFTQECFVPEQDGYFIKNWNGTSNLFEKNDDDKTYTSTEVEFMENKINEVDLILNSPYSTWEESIESMNIVEIDIIYKQSNEQNLRVVETLEVGKEKSSAVYNLPVLRYKYKSETPYKTLPDKDLLRVYDKVPVRAKTQEWAENRVIYGNFFDKPTPPDTLNYIVGVNEKDGVDIDNIRIEYQNHTLKQNRSYQAGIVLSDRYGRQSSVILASDDASTYFHPFKDGGNTLAGCICQNCVDDFFGSIGSQNSFSWYDTNATSSNLLGGWQPTGPTDTWPGDCLNLTFLDTINSNFNSSTGTPGLYQGYGVIDPDAIEWISYGTGYFPASYSEASFVGQGSGSGVALNIEVDVAPGPITGIEFDKLGENYKQGDIINIPGGDNNASFRILNLQQPNPTGWYSWKVVVKQPQTDYYNVYTAGMLNGFIDGEGPNAGFPDNTLVGATPEIPVAHFAIYGDNINKIPRDLSLVGPTQNVFRSGRPSVKDDPSYYDFVDTSGNSFTVNPYESDAEVLLKQRDRELALDSGSQINNALVNLSPRVINSIGGTSFGDNTQLKQWYPGEVYSTVITLGTGVELGLWDPSANQPYNTAPVFYGYENNPLIAKMNIGVSTAAQNYISECERQELSIFGRFGPSPEGGMLRYSVGPTGVVAAALGDEYVPTSKNVGGKPLAGTSTHPAPFNKTGEDGSGILFNITGVEDPSTGSLTSDPDIMGPLKDRGINVANNEGQNGVKGFISPNNTYPYDVQYQIIGSGDGEGKVRVTIEKEHWPGKMEPNLAILETQAFESKLDIYWETTTSGLIEDLNTRILEDDEFSVRSLKTSAGGVLNYRQRESDSPGTNVFSGEIAAFSSTGTIVDNTTMVGPVTMSLDSVISQGVNVTGFELVPGTVGGHYILQTTEYFAYCTPSASNTFEFTITVKSPTPTYPVDGTFQFETFEFTHTLLNSQPVPFSPCPAPDVLSKASVGSWPEQVHGSAISNGVDWMSWNGMQWLGGNGACGLEWVIQNKIGDIVKMVDSGGSEVAPGPTTFSWNAAVINDVFGIQIFFEETIPLDTYTITYGALDSGGLSYECTFEIEVTS
jgi:hypothetical protein